jgi:hypothetical protein
MESGEKSSDSVSCINHSRVRENVRYFETSPHSIIFSLCPWTSKQSRRGLFNRLDAKQTTHVARKTTLDIRQICTVARSVASTYETFGLLLTYGCAPRCRTAIEEDSYRSCKKCRWDRSILRESTRVSLVEHVCMPIVL